MLCFVTIVTVSLTLQIVNSTKSSGHLFFVFCFIFLHTHYWIASIRLFRWYPGRVDFFKNGVTIFDNFTSWEKFEIHRSLLHANQIVLVSIPTKSMGRKETLVWVDESSIDAILSLRET